MNKKEARQLIRKRKQRFTLSEKRELSAPVLQKLEQHQWFDQADTIMMYWSMDDEVSTHDFIEKWHHSKRIILPTIDGNDLILKPFCGKEQMKPDSQFGILEPQGASFSEYDTIDLIVVPGVAFDKSNNRLGRGRGFYDKLLKRVDCRKIGIAFEFQIMDNVPVDEHDVVMDAVIW